MVPGPGAGGGYLVAILTLNSLRARPRASVRKLRHASSGLSRPAVAMISQAR